MVGRRDGARRLLHGHAILHIHGPPAFVLVIDRYHGSPVSPRIVGSEFAGECEVVGERRIAGVVPSVYVDGVVPANVALVPATGIEGFTKPQITALSSTVTAVSLMGPAPAGYYSVEFVTHADDLSFKQDQVLTVVSQNVAFSLLNSVASDGQTMQPA